MASFAEMMTQSALTEGGKQGDGLAQAFQGGAELALKKEATMQAQQQLQLKKQEIENNKFDKIGGFFDTLAKMPEGPAKKAFSKGFIPKAIAGLGMADKIDPTVLEMMTSDTNLNTYLRSEITAGRMSVADLQNPDLVAKKLPEALRNTSAAQITAAMQDAPEQYVKATEEGAKNSATAAAAQAEESRFQRGQAATENRDIRSSKEDLSKQRNTLGIPSLVKSFKEVDALIPGGIDGYKPGTPIPGVSGADSNVPMNWNSPSGIKMKQAAEGVKNQILKLRSGGAVSDGEATRLLTELGMKSAIGEGGGWTAIFKGTPSANTFANGMKSAREKIKAVEENFARGYSPEVYKAVAGNDTLLDQTPGAPSPTPVPQAPAPVAAPVAKAYGNAKLDANPSATEGLKAALMQAPTQANIDKVAAKLGVTGDQIRTMFGLPRGK